MKQNKYYLKVIVLLFFVSISNLFSKISIESKTTIEENEDCIFQTISYIDVSNDGNRILISDAQSGTICQINYSSGKIINYLVPDLTLCDIVANSTARPYKQWEMKNNKVVETLNWKFITFKQAENIYPGKQNQETMFGLIINNFSISKYNKTGIISLSNIDVPKISDPFVSIFVQGATEFFQFDNNLKGIKIFPLNQENKDIPPIPASSNFCIFKNYYYITSLDPSRASVDKKSDSLPILAVYDKNGNFIKIKRYLPYYYEFSELGYTLTDRSLLLANDEDDLYASFWFVDYIDFLNKSYHLKLKDLPYAQKDDFRKLKKYCLEKGSFDVHYYEIFRFLPLMINNIIPVKNDIAVLSSIYTVTGKEYILKEYYLQLYHKTGELVKQDTISNNNKNGALKYVTYNKAKNKLLLFRKDDKKGWSMETAKWD